MEAPLRSLAAANLANFAACQAGWFACVLGAAHGMAGYGVIAALVVIAGHLAWSSTRASDLMLLAAAGGVGLIFDGTLARAGLVVYAPGALMLGPVPDWILALWLLFALMLRRSLAWLAPRPLLAAALGLVGGPLAYLAGARLGALQFPELLPALAALAIGWAAGTPALCRLSVRLSR